MNNRQKGAALGMKMVFGFFMVFVYLGMAALMVTNFFDWSDTPFWKGVRWFFAALFAAYGLYRGYRELKGEHTYGMRKSDEDEPRSASYVERLKELENLNQETENNEEK